MDRLRALELLSMLAGEEKQGLETFLLALKPEDPA